MNKSSLSKRNRPMSKNRKPFTLVLINSSIHSVDFAINAVRQANPTLSDAEVKSLIGTIMMKGRATIVSGSRKSVRAAASVIRNLGGDKQATEALSRFYGITVPNDSPIPYRINRGGRISLPPKPKPKPKAPKAEPVAN